MGYSIVSLLIILFELCLVVYLTIQYLKHKKKVSLDTAWYFIPVFLILYVLYAMGLVYDSSIQNTPLSIYQFLNIFSCCFAVFKASISTDNIALLQANVYYELAFFIAVILSLLTIILFIFGVVNFLLVNKIKSKKLLLSGADVLIGKCDDALTYASTHSNTLFYMNYPLSNEDRKFLRANKLTYVVGEFNAKNIERFFINNKIAQFNLIALDEKDNLTYITEFKKALKNTKTENLNLYVKLSYNNFTSINNKILEDKIFAPYITCFNKYDLIARKFIEHYPITKFLPDDFIDSNLPIISPNKQLNVFYFGFGKISKALHRLQVMNDQLATIDNGVVKECYVNYYAYDIKKTNDKNALFYDNRYFKEYLCLDKTQYFELPEKLCNFEELDNGIESYDVYNHFTNLIDNKNAYHNVIVSFGSDIDNIDYALKIDRLFKQNDVKNYHLFIRTAKYQKEYGDFFDKNTTFFGQDNYIINHTVIVDENLTYKGKKINESYSKNQNALLKWNSLSAIKKNSNLYSGLNLRLKLNLLNYDLALNTKTNFSSEVLEELKQKLLTGAPSFTAPYDDFLFFKKSNCPANLIAYQEKLRWNAFYILNGYMPMKKSNIKYINGKIYKDDDLLCEHACITTVWGLDEYHRLVANIISENENKNFDDVLNETQTYKYDYSFIDLLNSFNSDSEYVIVKKVNNV